MTIRIAALLVLCAVAVGCAQEAPPQDPEVFLPRPTEIRTSEVAPCSMLTPAQQRALGAEDPEESTATVNGRPAPTCGWLSDTDLGYDVQTIPIGAEVAVTEPAAVVIVVNGFGAVRSIPRELTGGTPFCQVTVDAGPGQSIRIQAQGTGARPRSDEEMCRIATDVAGMVMSTVVESTR